MAFLDAEQGDVAFAVKGDVILVLLWLGILGIRTDPVKGAIQILGQITLDLAVIEIILGAADSAAGAASATEQAAVFREL